MKRPFCIMVEALTTDAIQAASERINACVADINSMPIKAIARIEVLDAHKKLIAPAGLSEREVQVLEMIAAGQSNKQIALALDLTEGTVKIHNTSIFKKIGAANRTQAASWALDNGIATSGREGASC